MNMLPLTDGVIVGGSTLLSIVKVERIVVPIDGRGDA